MRVTIDLRTKRLWAMTKLVNPDRIAELGDRSENLFEKLCIGARFSRTRPGKDDKGWDFFVELQQNRLTNIDLDAQPAAVKFLCQVKGTDNFASRKLRMKVSNFEHLARTPLPTFLLIVDFKGHDEPQHVYFCHFDYKRIGQTLKRIRELQAKGKVALHNHSMYFSAYDSEEINFDVKGGFFTKILQYTGSDLTSYVSEKSDTLKKVGFDKGAYKFSFSTETSVSDFVDSFLGISEIKVSAGLMSSSRFEIEIEQHRIEAGILRIEPTSAGVCEVVASSVMFRSRIQLTGRVYIPSIPNLPIEHLKIRVDAGYIKMFLKPPSGTINIELNPDVPYRFNELFSTSKLLGVCTYPDAKIQCSRNGAQFAKFSFRLDEDWFKYNSRLVFKLSIIERFLKLTELRYDFLIRENDVYSQNESYNLMAMALGETSQVVTSNLENSVGRRHIKAEGTFATPIVLNINDQYLVAFAHWNAEFKLRQSKITCKVQQCKIWNIGIYSSSEVDRIKTLHKEFEIFCKELSSGTLMFRTIEHSESPSR